MLKDIQKLIISIVGCELVGILGTPFTLAAIPSWYATLNKPFFTPPSWLFGPAWTLLYFLMGISFYLIWKQGWKKRKVRIAGTYFLVQLGLNFLWTPAFFGLRSPLLGLFIITALWALIASTIQKFYPLSKTAGYLLVPYLAWVSFATLLNVSLLLLN